MSGRVHKLKCWPSYWDAVAAGEKLFEVRRDDRGFQKGDYLVLQKFDPANRRYVTSGSYNSIEERTFRITYVLTGGQLGIEPGHVVLSLKKAIRP